MEQELLSYLDEKFTNVENKIDTCAKSEDVKTLTARVTLVENTVGKHSQVMYAGGLLSLAAAAEWFNWLFNKK